MERRRFNQFKKNVLELLESKRASSSSEIAAILNAEVTNVCDCLNRLHKLRLVDRQPLYMGKKGRARYNYRINPRGLARIRYLERERTMAG